MQRPEQINSQALEYFGDDRYLLTIESAKRAKRLISGEPNLLDVDTRKMKHLDIALLELSQGKTEGLVEVKK